MIAAKPGLRYGIIGPGQPPRPGFDIHDIGHGAAGLPCGDQIRQQSFRQRGTHRLDKDPDRAATGQPDGESVIIADTVFQQARCAVFQRVERLDHHRALDTAA